MSGLSRVRFVELRGFSTVLQMLLLPDSFPRGTTGQAALLMFRIASSEEIPAADARTALVALVRALKQQQVRYACVCVGVYVLVCVTMCSCMPDVFVVILCILF